MTVVRRLAGWAWTALLLEVAVYRGLLRWVLRRPDVPAGATPIGYARLVTPVLALWIFASAVEVPVVDLLLPWDSLRLPVLVVGIWGVLWMLGLLGAYRTRPHLLLEDELVIRCGLRVEVRLPRSALASAVAREADLPSSLRSVAIAEDLLQVGVSGRTNLQLRLTGPTTLNTPKGPVTVTRVEIWVDEPREVSSLLRLRPSARLPRRTPPSPPRNLR